MARVIVDLQVKVGLQFLRVLLWLHYSVLSRTDFGGQSFNADDCAAITANGACNCTYNTFESSMIYCGHVNATASIRIMVRNDNNVEILCQGRIGTGCNATHPCIPAELLARLPRLGRMRNVDFLSIRYCLPFTEILAQLALQQVINLQLHGLEFIPYLQQRHFGNNLSHLHTVSSLELLAQNLQHLHDEQSLTLLTLIPPNALPSNQRLEISLLSAFAELRALTIVMRFELLPVEIFRPVARTLSELYLLGRLRTFPREAVSTLRALKQINMEGHQLAARLRENDFAALGTLEELYLRHCAITTLPPYIFYPLVALTRLSLTQNKLRVLPNELFAQQRHLQMLDLIDNQLEALPPALLASATALQAIYLTRNRLRHLSANLLPPRNSLLEFYADLNELRVIELGAFANARHLRDLFLNGNKLDWSDAEACGVLEGLNSLQMLGLQNNSLRFLCEQLGARNHSGSALRSLDVRKNKFTHLSAQLLRTLNSSETLRYVYLDQNVWTCDCSAQPLHAFVRSNRARFREVEHIKCSEPKPAPLFELAYRDFCLPDLGVNATLVFSFTSVLALTLLIIIIALCYYKYKLPLKIWLYAHSCCLQCISEAELDRERKYDAFISYTHQDARFVEDELLPGMEHGTPPFKVCIHVRDWLVGSFISDQIIDSVEQSRRTIIVLSQNFIHSDWARMEFRIAHQCALNEGRTRIILLIYGDLKNTELLDQELRAYLKMNTYLKWGEPWFWEKLRYAMPHSRRAWEREERAKKRADEIPLQVMTTRV